jgi:hypothetical protein
MLKKILFVVGFILVTLILPAFVLLLFVDAASNFAVYVVTFGVIIFAVLGYLVASVRSMEKKFEETMEEIKMQNAAIAYKITNPELESNAIHSQQPVEPVVNNEPVASVNNIPLNPAEPLVMPQVKKNPNIVDDGFDDFK